MLFTRNLKFHGVLRTLPNQGDYNPEILKDLIKEFTNNDIKAFAVLGISVGLKWDKIQQKFKKLVKKFHPDINSGDKNYEEKLKVITLA